MSESRRTIYDLERVLRSLGIDVLEFRREKRVSYQTFHNWKKRGVPESIWLYVAEQEAQRIAPKHQGYWIAENWQKVPEDVKCALWVIMCHTVPGIERRKETVAIRFPDRRIRKSPNPS